MGDKKDKSGRNTSELMRMLQNTPEQFKKEIVSSANGNGEEPSFEDYLKDLMKQKNVSAGELMQRAAVSKTYFYQFLSGDRLPGRNTALRLSFSLKLTVKETQKLLTLAEKPSLYPKVRRDAAILYCLKKKQSLDEANQMLLDLDEEPLLQ